MDYRKSADIVQKELLSEIEDSYEKSKGYFLWDILKAVAIGIKNLLEKLHGTKHLVRGNHDKNKHIKSPLWASVSELLHLRLGNEANSPKSERVDIFICHYPLRSWNGHYHGSFHIYGHTL